jgi:hypothetical protein
MATKLKPFRARSLSMGQQMEALMRDFPISRGNLGGNSKLVWIGKVQPTPLSAAYTIQIIYRARQRPTVHVVEPTLRTREGKRLPHVFHGRALCIYRAKYGEWNSSKLISSTILTWTSLWLAHYEIWLSTGIWCGSKAEHPTG